MSTQTRERASETTNPHLEIHLVCETCSPNGTRAACGAPLQGLRCDTADLTCPVCIELIGGPCPRCHQ